MAVGKPTDPQLGQAALGGTLWSVLGLFAARGTSALVQIALARLLAPEAFGVVGMAIVFTAIMGTIGDLGMAGALVQMRRNRLHDDHLNSAGSCARESVSGRRRPGTRWSTCWQATGRRFALYGSRRRIGTRSIPRKSGDFGTAEVSS